MEGENRQFAALLATVLLRIVLGVLLRKKLSRSYRHLLDGGAPAGNCARPAMGECWHQTKQGRLHRPTNASPTIGHGDVQS